MIDYQKAVKELRDKLILTQSELANLLGVSLSLQSIDGNVGKTNQQQRLNVRLLNFVTNTKLKLKRQRNNVRKRRIFD